MCSSDLFPSHDTAVDKAALQAKIAKIDEDIKAAHDIKSAIPVDIKHFVDAEVVGDLMDDLADSIFVWDDRTI